MTHPIPPIHLAEAGDSPRIIALEDQVASIFRYIGMEWINSLGGISSQAIEAAIAADGVFLHQQHPQGPTEDLRRPGIRPRMVA